MRALVLLLLAVLSLESVHARDIGNSRAQAQGMSSDRLASITALTQGYVDRKQLSGVVTLVARNGRIVHLESVGSRGLTDPAPISENDLFRIYSMTKPVTAVAAMMLYEQGGFTLTDPVSKYLPELAQLKVWSEDGLVPVDAAPTMRQLMTHTAGFGYGLFPGHPVEKLYAEAKLFRSADLDDYVARVAKLPLRYQPGERWHYSIASTLLGAVVERISGQPFDEYLQEHLFAPLAMNDTFFVVPADKLERLLPNSIWDREKGQMAEVSSALDIPFDGTTVAAGGAGLISTMGDYLRFAEMLRRGGELDGVRILSPKTVDFMTSDHLSDELGVGATGERPTIRALTNLGGVGFGLGFGVLDDPVTVGVVGSEGEFTWGGAAGTIFWVDPVEEIVVIVMLQQVLSPWPLRRQIKVLVNAAITQSYAQP
ncbi:MAG: beta-lactamase family protein [Pseudomonadaceae bacterium]|nr:beta-lactamase family protein [Pseudomonadaceae bacterium]